MQATTTDIRRTMHTPTRTVTGRTPATEFDVRVLRQDAPGEASYWERHRIEREPDMNVISVLQRIAAQAKTVEGAAGRPGRLGLQLPGRGVRRLHDAGQRPRAAGLHGAGRSAAGRQSRRDRAAADGEIPRRSRPGGESPPAVPRAGRSSKPGSRSMATTTPGPARAVSPEQQQQAYPLQRVHELRLLPGCLPAVHQDRTGAARRGERRAIRTRASTTAYDTHFVGAHAISQVMLFNAHPTGELNAGERLDLLTAAGRHSGLRQRAELRERLPQKDSAHHARSAARLGGDRPHREMVLRPRLGCRPGRIAWKSHTTSIG